MYTDVNFDMNKSVYILTNLLPSALQWLTINQDNLINQ